MELPLDPLLRAKLCTQSEAHDVRALPLSFETDPERGPVVAAQHIYLLLGHGAKVNANNPYGLMRADNLRNAIREHLRLGATGDVLQSPLCFPDRSNLLQPMLQPALTVAEALRCILACGKADARKLALVNAILSSPEITVLFQARISDHAWLEHFNTSTSKASLTNKFADNLLRLSDDGVLASRALGSLLRGSSTGKNVRQNQPFCELLLATSRQKKLRMERRNRLAGLWRAVRSLANPGEPSEAAPEKLDDNVVALMDRFLVCSHAHVHTRAQCT